MLGRHFLSKFCAPSPLSLNSEILQDVLQHTTTNPVLHFHKVRSQTKSRLLTHWFVTNFQDFASATFPHLCFVSGDKDFSFSLLHASPKLQITVTLSEPFSEFQDPRCHLFVFFYPFQTFLLSTKTNGHDFESKNAIKTVFYKDYLVDIYFFFTACIKLHQLYRLGKKCYVEYCIWQRENWKVSYSSKK